MIVQVPLPATAETGYLIFYVDPPFSNDGIDYHYGLHDEGGSENNNGWNSLSVTLTAPSNPILSVTPVVQPVGITSGSTTFTVINTGTGSMAWTAATSESWVHITSGFSGTDAGMITVAYDANSGASRSGEVTVSADGASEQPTDRNGKSGRSLRVH